MSRGDALIGVDLGGTKIECAVMAPDGSVTWRERVLTPVGQYEATLDAIAGLVRSARHLAAAAPGVGVAWPGSTSPVTGLHRNANSTCLNGKPLRADLERRLGMPVRGSNDANCFALSEAADGAAQGSRCVFGVILGTGCGGGVVVEGRLLEGCNGVTGEWGHMPLPQLTPEEVAVPGCWCGRGPCLEVFLSGPAVEADHARHGGRPGLRLPGISEAARHGDALAVAVMDRWLERLGRALAVVCNLLDPDTIVLGGGASLVPGVADRLPGSIMPHMFTDVFRTRVTTAAHGDSSGVRGAARLFATLSA